MSFEVQIEKLIYGGDALGHHNGKPVFVSQTLPGERIEAEPTHTLKGILHSRPVRILAASTERVDPPCPYFGRCGGCQYQHMVPTSQTIHKVEILRETLSRIGKVSWASEIIAHSGPAWGYRNQAQFKLTVEPGGNTVLGFFAASSHDVVPVETCNIISPSLGMVLGKLQTWIKENSGSGIGTGMEGCREIDLMADHNDENVMMTFRGEVNPANSKHLADTLFNVLPQVKTVATESQVPGQEFQVFGQPSLNYQAGDFNYRVSPGTFFQTSRFLIPQLIRRAASIPQQKGSENGSPPLKLALDLYAGAGLFALPLARQFQQVIAVESNPSSAADLAANASRGRHGRIRAVHQPVFDFLKHSHNSEPDLVVIDPPRAGVGLPTLRLLTNLCPRRIHYVSCHPPTLARDLAFLLAARYRIESIQMFDFFPQTYHIECLVALSR